MIKNILFLETMVVKIWIYKFKLMILYNMKFLDFVICNKNINITYYIAYRYLSEGLLNSSKHLSFSKNFKIFIYTNKRTVIECFKWCNFWSCEEDITTFIRTQCVFTHILTRIHNRLKGISIWVLLWIQE